jgi:DNA-binding transcriptional LysR family regulator
MVRLEDVQILLQTAQLGSLSAAARALDISPAVASAALKRLEQELGSPAGALHPQPAADCRWRALSGACPVALDALQAGAQALAAGRQTLQGQLSLSMPSDIGRQRLRPGWMSFWPSIRPCAATAYQ